MLKVIEWPIYILLIDCEGFNEGFFFPVLPCIRQSRVQQEAANETFYNQTINRSSNCNMKIYWVFSKISKKCIY